MERKYSYVLVGAGLHNIVFANLARANNYSCLILEKRNHIGGNCYDEKIEGINVHKYGAHIFHTSDEEVWRYMSQFTKFNNFINSPLAEYKNELYNLPFNMNTFHQIWPFVTTPKEAQERIKKQVVESGITDPKNLEEKAISLVGTDIYERLVKCYTEKQWGMKCSELPPDIITRLPVRFTYDNNYFNDKYQGIPDDGYTIMMENMLAGCDVKLGVDYFDDKEYWDSLANNCVVYSGPIDRYFDYCYGKLDWRSLRFEHYKVNEDNYQGNAVINNCNSGAVNPQTRVIEHKHFDTYHKDELMKLGHTYVTMEFPMKFKDLDTTEPYYPINDDKNMELLGKYNELAEKEKKVIFGGRLAEYKYYDMDKVVKSAMKHFTDSVVAVP